MLWFILFTGVLGAAPADMHPVLAAGPFPTLQLCASAAALGINDLNRLHPDKDFRADCSPSSEIVRRPGVPLLDLQQLADIAGANR